MLHVRTVMNGKVNVVLAGGKSKVIKSKNIAPTAKPELTLPRLELMAAELLSSQMAKLNRAFPTNIPVRAFSDSKVTLAWIQGDLERWDTFVQNRVKKIVSEISREDWYYVNTKENSSDLPSRAFPLHNCWKQNYGSMDPIS